MIIRRLLESDVPDLLHIMRDNWGVEAARSAHAEINESFSSAVWKPIYYVAVDGQEVVACASYMASWINYGIYDLAWVSVMPSRQGRGIGKALVNQCISDIRAVGTLIMLSTEKPGYYERHWGFKTLLQHEGWDMMALDLRGEESQGVETVVNTH